MTDGGPWWAPLRLAIGDTASLRLGPLALHLHRAGDEWMVGLEREGGEEVHACLRETTRGRPEVRDWTRYVFRTPDGDAAFRPALADRPVVIRPRQSVFVLPGEETTFYMSTVIWVEVTAGPQGRVLQGVPVYRLSDTWFGPSTREGELCYAARTHARNALEEVPLRPHRAVTPVRIENRADTPLQVEKLSLPVPMLSVWGGDDGGLWTESVRLLRTTDSDMAAVKVEAGPPPYVRGATLLTGPRRPPEKIGLVRAFSGIFD